MNEIFEKFKKTASYVSPNKSEYFFNLRISLEIIDLCKEKLIPIYGYDVFTIFDDGIRDEGVYLFSSTEPKVGRWTSAQNGILKWIGKPNIVFSLMIDENSVAKKDQ